MPEVNPIDVVEEILKKGKFDEAVISKVKEYLRANSPEEAETMAADRALRQRSNESFAARFPDGTRLRGA